MGSRVSIFENGTKGNTALNSGIDVSQSEYSSIVALWLMMDLPFLCNHAVIDASWMFSGRSKREDSLEPVTSSVMAVSMPGDVSTHDP